MFIASSELDSSHIDFFSEKYVSVSVSWYSQHLLSFLQRLMGQGSFFLKKRQTSNNLQNATLDQKVISTQDIVL